jgi:sugar O-acyltransferase (sialic acid O-acetyltransferase NeuD family)
MKVPLIIIGTGDYAEVAYHFLQEHDEYDVIGFSEESAFIKKTDFNQRPIYKFEELQEKLNPSKISILVAVGPNRMNTVRERLYNEVKSKGFKCIRYIHRKAIVWSENAIGDNTFIFPGCVVEPFVTIGNNCVLWTSSLIAHHSAIGNHCFIAPGCNISGRVTVKQNSFLGINSTVRDNITIAERSLIGAGAVIKKDTVANGVYSADGTLLYNANSLTTKV